MKNHLLAIFATAALAAPAQTPSVWSLSGPVVKANRIIPFDINAQGEKLPILWGFDTAWNDRANMLRGLRYSGTETVGVARVSFQPWDVITEKGKLPAKLQRNLEARLANVALAGKKVDIALNLDGGEPTVKEVYGYLDENNNYIGDKEAVADAYALLIDATAAAVEKAGYRVVSAAPFNEPDYFWNGTPIDVFDLINRRLKNHDEYPRFSDIRISGGNTLNCDQALPWYEGLKDFLDEGNTHQLAGDFDHYAEFFTRVRQDGKYATADELHNVMEAMVGVEYGMQTGIWWGTAEQARGRFMQASFGERLGYAENRNAWSAASVYRSPDGSINGFAGCSERQARPSAFNYLSVAAPVFVDGDGPLQEYCLSLPGDPSGEYQTEKQRNAETVISIHNGEDVQPYVSGSYALVNALASHPVAGGKGGSTDNGTDIVSQSYTSSPWQHWTVSRIPEDTGGDFSYYFIRNTATGQALDDNNWNIETGGKVIAYAPGSNSVQQWALEYDGNGWFHIRNKHSALYLDAQNGAEGTMIVQNERADIPSQRWRFIPEGAPLAFEAPASPAGLKASVHTASISLSWDATGADVTYTVLRGDDDGNRFITVARGLTGTALIDNSVSDNKSYTYKVIAEDRSGNRSACSAEVTASVTGTEALIGHFPMTENLSDLTGNGFDLKSRNTAAYGNSREDGTPSAFFRRSQFLQLPYSILDRDRFTLAIWFSCNTATNGQRLFSTGTDPDHCLYFSPAEDGMARLIARNGDNEAIITADAVPTSAWTHAALTVDGSDVTLYINGQPVNDTPAHFGAAMPERKVLSYIAGNHDTEGTYFSGYADNLQVYNYPLSPGEVKNAMNSYGSGVESVAATSSAVVATEYYNLQGVRIAAPTPGTVTIIRTVFADGTSTVAKTIR